MAGLTPLGKSEKFRIYENAKADPDRGRLNTALISTSFFESPFGPSEDDKPVKRWGQDDRGFFDRLGLGEILG